MTSYTHIIKPGKLNYKLDVLTIGDLEFIQGSTPDQYRMMSSKNWELSWRKLTEKQRGCIRWSIGELIAARD